MEVQMYEIQITSTMKTTLKPFFSSIERKVL